MTTCRDIITRAYQLAKIIPLGVDPKAKESDLGLEVLQSMFDNWVHDGMFGGLSDVLATQDHTVGEGERVRYSSDYAVTIPTAYAQDGAEGDERAPYDLSLIETYNTTTATRSVKLWDRNVWVELTGLTLNDAAPLAERGKIGLASCLAVRLAETFGDDVPSNVIGMAARFTGALSGKVSSTQPAPMAEYF